MNAKGKPYENPMRTQKKTIVIKPYTHYYNYNSIGESKDQDCKFFVAKPQIPQPLTQHLKAVNSNPKLINP